MRTGSKILLYPIHSDGVGKPLQFVSQVEASYWLGKSRFYIHERISRHHNIAKKENGIHYYINYGQDKFTQEREVKQFLTEYNFVIHEKKYQQIGTVKKISKEERKQRNKRFAKGLDLLYKLEDKYGYKDYVPQWTFKASYQELIEMRRAFGVKL